MQKETEKENNAAGERRNRKVLAAVESRGETSVPELAESAGCSVSTVQRSLAALESADKVVWLRGGRVALKQATGGPRSDIDGDRSGVEAVLKIIKDNHAIVLDASPFSLALVQRIDKGYNGTIVVHSPRIADALSGHSLATVRMIGGRLQNGIVIPEEPDIRFLQNVVADPCVLGTCCIDLDSVSIPNGDELQIKQAMIAHARTVVVVVSSADLNKKSNFILGPLSKITHLVLQNGAGNENVTEYEQVGLEIIRP